MRTLANRRLSAGLLSRPRSASPTWAPVLATAKEPSGQLILISDIAADLNSLVLHPHIKALSLLYVNLLDVLLVPEVSHRVQVLTR